jgi:hypothetical protein
MARYALTLNGPSNVEKARAWLARAIQLGWRVEFKEPKRSDPQNDRMWEMLGRVSKRMTIHGRKFTPEQWKCIFMHEMGRQTEVLPSLNGETWFPSGFRSSDLSVSEMSDLQTFIEAWCAEQGADVWAEEARAA